MSGMPDAARAPRARVVIVTPVGPDGMGGIDRLYYYMREHRRTAGESALDIRYVAARGDGGSIKWMLLFPFRLIAFLWTLLTFQPDVVHINHSTHGSALRKWAFASLAKLLGKTVTTHFHGLVAPEDYARNPLWLSLFRSLCAKSDRIVILGDFFAQDFARRFGIGPEKLIVIPNGIPDYAADLPIPKAKGNEITILFAGEVGPRKGAGLLLEALATLRRQTQPWRCVIAGNGDIHEYRSMAQMLGLKDRVSFTGWVGSDQVHALMRTADIVVLPSRIEALPLSLIEGACAGAALVSSSAGASAEIAVEGRNGIIVPLHSEAIAAALGRLLHERRTLERMQSESRRLFVERFRIEKFDASLTAFLLGMAKKQAVESEGAVRAL